MRSMNNMTRSATALLSTVMLGATALAGGPAGTTITYQGQLKDAGTDVDALTNMEFRLFDANTGGSQVGTDVIMPVDVVDGLFTAQLDFGIDPYVSSQPLWLEVTVEGQALTRQAVTSAPFSLATRGLNVDLNGNIGIGTDTPLAPLHIKSGIGPSSFVPNDAVRTVLENTTGRASLQLINGSNGGFSQIYFGDADNLAAGQVRYSHANDHLSLVTGGATSVVVAPSGNVGIGTGTNPTEKLAVEGNILASGSVTAGSFVGDGSGLTGIAGGSSVWTEDGSDVYYDDGSVGIGTPSPSERLAVRSNGNARIRVESPGNPGIEIQSDDAPNQWTVRHMNDGRLEVRDVAAASTRMTIRDSGFVGIGTTTPSEKLEVTGTVKATSFSGDGSALTNLPVPTSDVSITEARASIFMDGTNDSFADWEIAADGDSTTSSFLEVRDTAGDFTVMRVNRRYMGSGTREIALYGGGSGVNEPVAVMGQSLNLFGAGRLFNLNDTVVGAQMDFKSNGESVVRANDFQTTSDARLKKNVRDIERPLETIVALRGVTFDWIDMPAEHQQVGFIAQEVEQVLPSLVDTNAETDMKSMNYADLTAVLVEAVKAQQIQIEALRTEVEALRSIAK